MIQKVKPPYCYEFYNISAWFQTSLVATPVIARITNSLIEALNDTIYLPKYVIIIIDKDLVQDEENKGFGAKKAIEDHLFWVVKQISRALLTRREDLKQKCPGAVTADLTRVVWIKMLTRPITRDASLKRIWKLRPKFNDALDNILGIEKYMHVINVPRMDETKYFDERGQLTPAGKRVYWRNINGEIKSLDTKLAEAQCIRTGSIKPDESNKTKVNKNNSCTQANIRHTSEKPRFPTHYRQRLPTPPPSYRCY